jgi:hypothetical protein
MDARNSIDISNSRVAIDSKDAQEQLRGHHWRY